MERVARDVFEQIGFGLGARAFLVGFTDDPDQAFPVCFEPEHDPLAAAYELLRLEPGCDLTALEAAYQARLSELDPAPHAAGSPERAGIEARQNAVSAAYEKLRDALNPTETRFERLEF